MQPCIRAMVACEGQVLLVCDKQVTICSFAQEQAPERACTVRFHCAHAPRSRQACRQSKWTRQVAAWQRDRLKPRSKSGRDAGACGLQTQAARGPAGATGRQEASNYGETNLAHRGATSVRFRVVRRLEGARFSTMLSALCRSSALTSCKRICRQNQQTQTGLSTHDWNDSYWRAATIMQAHQAWRWQGAASWGPAPTAHGRPRVHAPTACGTQHTLVIDVNILACSCTKFAAQTMRGVGAAAAAAAAAPAYATAASPVTTTPSWEQLARYRPLS